MHDVLFQTEDGTQFLAKDRQLAEKIAGMYGQSCIELVQPSFPELEHIHNSLERYNTIKRQITALGYSSFLDMYRQYGGYDAQLSGVSLLGFTFDFAGFMMRVVYTDSIHFDETEILYRSSKYNRLYVLRSDKTMILRGSL